MMERAPCLKVRIEFGLQQWGTGFMLPEEFVLVVEKSSLGARISQHKRLLLQVIGHGVIDHAK